MPWWAWTIIGILGFFYVVGATMQDVEKRKREIRNSENLARLANEVKE